MSVSFKIEHCVYHVLQHSRSSHVPLLGNMTNDENRDSKSFCNLHQYIGRFSHLGNTSRRRSDFFVKHGLDGIYDCYIRFLPLHHFTHCIQIGFAQKLKILIESTDTVSTKFDLTQRFLA